MKNDHKYNPAVIDAAIELIDSDQSDLFLQEFEKGLLSAVQRTKGIYEARIETAVELTESEKERFRVFVERVFKSGVHVSYTVKKELLGGFRIRVGDWKLDATLTNQIEHILQMLKS